MTPEGVEHDIRALIANHAEAVIPSVTPEGVEHLRVSVDGNFALP